MIQSIFLSFFVGVFGANALPHFVKGITKEPFPTPFGPSPVLNLIAGWAMFILAGILGYWAHMDVHPIGAIISLALGVLLMGIFHALQLDFWWVQYTFCELNVTKPFNNDYNRLP
jgi:hypothetical protein